VIGFFIRGKPVFFITVACTMLPGFNQCEFPSIFLQFIV
jgi:hypothetical protein